MNSLGVKTFFDEENALVIESNGIHNFKLDEHFLDCGNSGTTARLLMGCLAPSKLKDVVIKGDVSLSKRPMERVAIPLRKMGADIKTTSGHLPVVLSGKKLSGIEYNLEIPSAQVKSAILIAALFASSKTILYEKYLTREHTEKILFKMGAKIEKNGLKIEVSPSKLKPLQYFIVPGDFSSAAYFIALAVLTKGSELVVSEVDLDEGRVGLIKVLKKMGADIDVSYGIGKLVVRYSELSGVDVEPEIIPSMIDEVPILALIMAMANGKSKINGLSELKFKESDRLLETYNLLKKIGASVYVEDDALEISGPTKPQSFQLKSFDHRILMTGVVASLLNKEGGVIQDANFIKISYPDFFYDLKNLVPGIKISF